VMLITVMHTPIIIEELGRMCWDKFDFIVLDSI
jgi:hypothetical protein